MHGHAHLYRIVPDTLQDFRGQPSSPVNGPGSA
jgi:hypothetical protein